IIPDPVFTIGEILITKSIFVLILFSLLMVVAALSMIRKNKREVTDCQQKIKYNIPIILGEGILVGAITGLVGAGGGFLIIPTLVLFGGLYVKKAAGSYLLLIALKSLIVFTGDIGSGVESDVLFMFVCAGVATIVIIAGMLISKYIANQKLNPAFGWFVLVM